MKIPSAFNEKEHGEMGSFEAIPAGTYNVKVLGSKEKDNKAKVAAAEKGEVIDGSVLTFTFEVTSGEFKGRMLFTGLNIAHTSDQTVEIAFKELNSIKLACGKQTLKNSDELHGCELQVTVKVVPKTAQWPAKNEITKYESLKGVAKPSNPGKKGKKKGKGPKVSFD